MTGNLSLANGDSQEYWKGARERRLLFQKCGACGSIQFPPRHHCASCWEADLKWVESRGEGTVESFTIVRRAPLPAFRGKVPYVVAAVLVEDGPRMITNLVGENVLDVKIGDKVRVDFEDNGSGDRLPQFRRL
jgi:uncharacterized OB-fold protein